MIPDGTPIEDLIAEREKVRASERSENNVAITPDTGVVAKYHAMIVVIRDDNPAAAHDKVVGELRWDDSVMLVGQTWQVSPTSYDDFDVEFDTQTVIAQCPFQETP